MADKLLKLMAEQQDEKYTREDRTLLIQVATKLDTALSNQSRFEKMLFEMKDNLVLRVDELERRKASEDEIKELYNTRRERWESTTKKLEQLELNKVDKEDCEDTKRRVSVLERWKAAIIGAFGLITLLVGLVVYIYIHQISENSKSIDDIKRLIEDHIIQSEVKQLLR